MKYYILNFPRPVGVDPTVYLVKPVLPEKQLFEDPETGEVYDDTCLHPDVEEFNTIKDAITRIVDFNGTDDYLKLIKVQSL